MINRIKEIISWVIGSVFGVFSVAGAIYLGNTLFNYSISSVGYMKALSTVLYVVAYLGGIPAAIFLSLAIVFFFLWMLGYE